MTPPQLNPDPDRSPEAFRWTRLDAADARAAFSDPFRPPDSQRQFARHAGVPRSTLQHWLDDERYADLEPDFVTFCRSPAGERFLRRLVLALHLVFNQAGHAGLRPLGCFLRLTALDRFVAPSYGAQQALAARLQDDLGVFADEQGTRLAAAMAPRGITLCADENFHGPHACLVAIEPVSDFIVLEAYHEHRDGPTWTAALQQALQGMPVEVIQMTSDQARGLLACARDGLGVHHSPDLFHDQQELTGATALPLHRQLQAAQQQQAEAALRTAAWQERQRHYAAGPRPAGRAPDFATRIAACRRLEQHAGGQVQACRQRQEQVRQAVRGLADDYHPFDATTGRPVAAAEVQQRLTRRLDAVEAVVNAAALGEKAQAAVARVRRWLVPLVATIGWFWGRATAVVEGWGLAEAAQRVVQEQVLSGRYWQAAAGRGRDAEQRQQLRALSGRLTDQAWSSGPLGGLAVSERQRVEAAVSGAAELFRRSSSCVEGRNGRLSLHHHGQGSLSVGRLRALTVVHNYLPRASDGTTAAERFFGVKPAGLFEWLLGRLPDLPRPGKQPKGASPERPQG